MYKCDAFLNNGDRPLCNLVFPVEKSTGRAFHPSLTLIVLGKPAVDFGVPCTNTKINHQM